MLAYLRGTIQSKEMTGGPADRLIIDVAGVGFELCVSRRTLLLSGQPGDDATMHVSLAIRENDWTIFGFANSQEREMFTLLQSVTGVGPKMALALVGTLGPEQLAQAILAEDHKLISSTPGVGIKMAQRLCLELKSKIDDWHQRRGDVGDMSMPSSNAVHQEVRSILEGLGYTATEIVMALQKAEDENVEHEVELLVRHSLRVLGTVSR